MGKRIHPLDKIKSREWAIGEISSVGVALGPGGGSLALYDLVNRDTCRGHRIAFYVATLGFGLDFAGSQALGNLIDAIPDDGYENFTTTRSVSFEDFDGAKGRLTSLDLAVFDYKWLTILDRDLSTLGKISGGGLGLSIPGATSGPLLAEVVWGRGNPNGVPICNTRINLPPPEEKIDIKARMVASYDSIILSLPDNALFGFDKDRIEFPSQKAILDKVAKYIIANYEYPRIYIVGHTDAVGSRRYNQGLSERRAKAVYDYLQTKVPHADRTWVPIGRGESRPKASNAAPAGRQENRRVEVILLRENSPIPD